MQLCGRDWMRMNLCLISRAPWQGGAQLRACNAQILSQPVQENGRHFTVAPHSSTTLCKSGAWVLCLPHSDPSESVQCTPDAHETVLAKRDGGVNVFEKLVAASAMTWHNLDTSAAFPVTVASCKSARRSCIHCRISSSHMGTKSSRPIWMVPDVGPPQLILQLLDLNLQRLDDREGIRWRWMRLHLTEVLDVCLCGLHLCDLLSPSSWSTFAIRFRDLSMNASESRIWASTGTS